LGFNLRGISNQAT